jgi:steroid delta-isomerase-like uncharacterized protein
MTRDEMLAFCARRQHAFETRDVPALAALHGESSVLESPLAGSATGRAGAARVYEAFFTAFPDAVVVSDPPIIDGDYLVLVGTMTGTHVGGFMGLPPSGRSFRFTIVHLLVVRDGQIVSERRVYDFTGFLVQIGVLKAKPA